MRGHSNADAFSRINMVCARVSTHTYMYMCIHIHRLTYIFRKLKDTCIHLYWQVHSNLHMRISTYACALIAG